MEKKQDTYGNSISFGILNEFFFFLSFKNCQLCSSLILKDCLSKVSKGAKGCRNFLEQQKLFIAMFVKKINPV